MSALTIAGTEIKQDQDGRFSLNDFHRAAGGENRHKPSLWTENQQAKDLIDEIGKAGIPALRIVKGGRAPGTYVCKELVYAYAMWVSPRFHLEVIRTFDAATRPAANDPVLPVERQLQVAADSLDAAHRIARTLGLEGNQALLSAGRMVKKTTGIDVLELAGIQRLTNEAQELNYTPTELGAKFSMNARDMNKLLEQCGLQRHFEYAKGKKRWELLPDGKPFAVIVDTPKKHSDGKPVQQILWKESVLEMLKRLAEKLRADLPKRPGGKV
jgi:hypothetical protein